MVPVQSHVFRGRRYRIVRERQRRAVGSCEPPHAPGKTICLDPKVYDGGRLHDLDTMIHEGLHACLWDLDEDSVEASATSIARFLWRMGWRRMAT